MIRAFPFNLSPFGVTVNRSFAEPRKPRRPAFVVPPPVAIIAADPVSAARCARGLRRDAVTSLVTLGGRIPVEARDAVAVVIDATIGNLANGTAMLDLLDDTCPLTPMVVCTRNNDVFPREVLLRYRGQRAIVLVECDETVAVNYRDVASALGYDLAGSIAQRMTAPFWQRLAYALIAGACTGLTVPALTAPLGMKYGRLVSRLSRGGLPTPYPLLMHARMTYASCVLGHRWRGVDQLTADIGWRANDSLEAWTGRLLSCTPRDLLLTNRFPEVRETFVAMLKDGETRESSRRGGNTAETLRNVARRTQR